MDNSGKSEDGGWDWVPWVVAISVVVLGSSWYSLRRQENLEAPQQSMIGKSVVITGANSGQIAF